MKNRSKVKPIWEINKFKVFGLQQGSSELNRVSYNAIFAEVVDIYMAELAFVESSLLHLQRAKNFYQTGENHHQVWASYLMNNWKKIIWFHTTDYLTLALVDSSVNLFN